MTQNTGILQFMIQSKLSRRIVALVFVLVLASEAAIVHTLAKEFERKSLSSLEAKSQTAFTALFLTHPYEMPDKMLLATVDMLLPGTAISGGIIGRDDGSVVGQFGEPPAPFVAHEFTKTTGGKLSADGTRYDVLWSAAETGTPYTLQIRLDSTRARFETEAFLERSIVVALTATLVITLGALFVIGPMVFGPLARLRHQVGLNAERAQDHGDEWGELIETVAHEQQRPKIDGQIIERRVEERTANLREQITHLSAMGEKLSRLAALTEHATTPILRLTSGCKVIYANGPARLMLSQWGSAIGSELPAPWSDRISSFMEHGQSGEIEEIVGDNTFLLNIVPTSNGEGVDIYGYDITERKQIESSRTSAAHDAFRGVNGRVALEERIAHSLAFCHSTGEPGAIHILRVDELDDAAVEMDHETGLQLMRKAMARLRTTIGSDDSVIRLGRALFGIVQERISSPVEAMEMAENLMAVISEPYYGNTHTIRTTACLVISTFPEDSMDSKQLVRNAEMALEHAISEGSSSVRFFVARLNEQIEHRHSLAADLRKALSKNEFSLNYQARLSLNSCRISGAEALIRWHHKGEVMLPDDFIPLAESCDVGPAIGHWSLRTACQQHKTWLEQGFPRVPLSVNVSTSLIANGSLMRAVEEALDASNLPADLLELAEGLVMAAPEQYGPILQTLHDMGVRIALDGFGTGYSSMEHLSNLAVDRIKIDPTFITKIGISPHASKAVRAASSLAHGIGLEVSAVGVETSDQIDFLQTLPIDEVQGYAFAAPMDASSFHAFVDNFTEATISFSPAHERSIGGRSRF